MSAPIPVTLATVLGEPGFVTDAPGDGSWYYLLRPSRSGDRMVGGRYVTHVRPGIAVELPEVTREGDLLIANGIEFHIDRPDDVLDQDFAQGLAALAVKLLRQQEAAATTPVPQEDDTMSETTSAYDEHGHVDPGVLRELSPEERVQHSACRFDTMPEPDPAPDLTAALRTVVSGPTRDRTIDYHEYGDALKTLTAALDSGAVLVAPDAPLAQRLTEQQLADVTKLEQTHAFVAAGAAARLRAALPTTGEEK